MHVYHPACVYSDFLVSCPAPPIPQHYVMIQHIECCMCNWKGLSITLVLCLLGVNYSSVSIGTSCVLILVNSISLQPSDHNGSSTQGGPLLIIHSFKASWSSSGQVWAFQVPLPWMCKQTPTPLFVTFLHLYYGISQIIIVTTIDNCMYDPCCILTKSIHKYILHFTRMPSSFIAHGVMHQYQPLPQNVPLHTISWIGNFSLFAYGHGQSAPYRTSGKQTFVWKIFISK